MFSPTTEPIFMIYGSKNQKFFRLGFAEKIKVISSNGEEKKKKNHKNTSYIAKYKLKMLF
jgi:hypothetical protein